MPKFANATSIRTLWENNPDTPMHASNLSRLQDLTTSYLNSDGFPDLYAENSILFVNPDDSTQLVVKRGTIIQIINESTDLVGTPVVPKNDQYRIFDVGLEDLILTPANTDDTHSNKTSWGSGVQPWFVYLCDKDDGSTTKGSVDDYGGGAQFLISKDNSFPVGEVPGRPGHFYSTGDTRIVGGFVTSGGDIITNSLWDIAGKFNTVKARSYHILDRIGGVYMYRQIALEDLDTSGLNTFSGNVSVQGDLSALDTSVSNLTAFGTTFTGVMNQTGDVSIDGDVSITGHTDFNTADFSQSVNFNGSSIFYSPLSVRDQTVDVFSVDPTARSVVIDADTTTINSHLDVNDSVVLNADLDVVGNAGITGTFDVDGDSSFTGNVTINDNVIISDSDVITVKSPGGIDDLMVFNQDTRNVLLNTDVTINGELNIDAGTSGLSLNSTQGITSSTGPSYSWTHSGSFVVNAQGGDYFKVVSGMDELFSIQPNIRQSIWAGNVEVNLADGEIFTIKDSDGLTILGVEDSGSPEYHKTVAINSSLRLSDSSAENALYVTGNGHITGDLEVEGTLIANIDGNTSGTAASWSSDLTITFNGDVTGTTTFDGSEGSVDVTLQVLDDSHNHDGRYYTETELQTSGQAQVHWNNVSSKPVAITTLTDGSDASGLHHHDNDYMPRTINDFWSVIQTGALVATPTPSRLALYSEIPTDYISSSSPVPASQVSLDGGTLQDFYDTDAVFLTGNNTFTGDTVFNGTVNFGSSVGSIDSDGAITATEAMFSPLLQLTAGNQLPGGDPAGLAFFNDPDIGLLWASTSDLSLNYTVNASTQKVVLEDDLDTALSGKADIGHSHTESEITDLDKYTRNEVDTALNGKADVGHSHTEFPRVWTTSPGGAQKTGDIYIGGGDVKICVDGGLNAWRLLTSAGATPP
jgi:cytoskeletal protein CcmA (bactofilin family)